jgi:hypothetical protein
MFWIQMAKEKVMAKKNVIARMEELMKPIDRQIMMCDNVEDVLMLASNMLITAKLIYVQNLGGAGAKELFQKLTDEIDERILPMGGEVPPDYS